MHTSTSAGTRQPTAGASWRLPRPATRAAPPPRGLGAAALSFATLYTAPARAGRSMRTRFVYENAHEAHIMATAQVNYYRSCGLDLIHDTAELAAPAKGWK